PGRCNLSLKTCKSEMVVVLFSQNTIRNISENGMAKSCSRHQRIDEFCSANGALLSAKGRWRESWRWRPAIYNRLGCVSLKNLGLKRHSLADCSADNSCLHRGIK